MRSVCFFAAYFTGSRLPYYTEVYLKELKKQFGEVWLLCSQQLSPQSLAFLKAEQIQFSIETNEGFDFGLWYKAFQKTNVEAYERVALVNDSCILFKPLNEFMAWASASSADFAGMTASDAVAPHLQSYFMIFNKPAIKHVKDYFKQKGLLKTIQEVISVYEIGMSSYLLAKGLHMAAYVDNKGYHGEFSPYYHCIRYHLAEGLPLIKKKILFSCYRKDELFTLARMQFDIKAESYMRLIKSADKPLILDFERLRQDKVSTLSTFDVLKYALTKKLVSFARLFRKSKQQ